MGLFGARRHSDAVGTGYRRVSVSGRRSATSDPRAEPGKRSLDELDLPVLPDSRREPAVVYAAAKRALDITCVAVAVPFVIPVAVGIAALIKLDSRGPVIFRQERFGATRIVTGDGAVMWQVKPFTFYKFRTMYHDSDSGLHERYMAAYMAGNEAAMAATQRGGSNQGVYKLADDPRVTPVGRFLRKLSLDELPQLWNILRGDMSVVGPRPALGYEIAQYTDGEWSRLTAKPGLTGWWQVNGRCETTFDEMIRLDLDYIERQSLALDAWILLKTIPAVLTGKGAG